MQNQQSHMGACSSELGSTDLTLLGMLGCAAEICTCLVCCVQNYLETKRIAFPRFYFVAPADLIDILSKGSDPQAILR